MSPSATDALCRISTGSGIDVPDRSGRHPLHAQVARPILITTPRTGDNDWTPRADLAHRALPVRMTEIAEPRTGEDLWAEFEAIRAQVLAALCTLVALRLQSETPPRHPCNRELCVTEMQNASAAADPLFKAIREKIQNEWTGTATDLLNDLAATGLANARVISHRLRHLVPALARAGITIDFHRTHGGIRKLTIRVDQLS